MADFRENVSFGLTPISYPLGAEAVSVSGNESFAELDRAVTVLYDGFRNCTKCPKSKSRSCRHMRVYNRHINQDTNSDESDVSIDGDSDLTFGELCDVK